MIKDKLNKILETKSITNEFSGAVLIKRGKEELFSGTYGYANRSFNIKNTLDTRFRIASISKMFTAVAILQLVEKEILDLDTKVTDYLRLQDSNIPTDVTIHHLLTHTSGIADYYDESLGDEEWHRIWKETPIYNIRSLKNYFKMFANKQPISNVGEKYHYNGAGYILLGLIIEKASGLTYFDYVRKYIFSKFKMINSDFLSLDEVHQHVAEGYELERDNQNIIWKRNVYTTTPTAASDGGATSTVYDLVNFIQSLRDFRLLNQEMTEKMLSPYVLDEASDGFRDYTWKYGYANQFLLKDNKVVRGGHTGEEYGVSCRLYYYPELNIDVVILGNQGLCAGKLGWEIHDLLMSYYK